MTVTSLPRVENDHVSEATKYPRLLPRAGITDKHPDTTAWWALDISRARPAIAAIAAGEGPSNWVDVLLAGVRIADVDENNVHLLGPQGGRARMIGQLFTDYCPPESWKIGAEFILAAIANYPAGAPRMRKITSLAFSNAWAEASTDAAFPDIVFIAVGGTIADDRSLWSLRASEERYRNLFHHLPYPLIQVDSRPMRSVLEELRDGGVTDIRAYLEATPELALHSRQVVHITDANPSALQLLGADRLSEILGPVDFIFAASPEATPRVIAAHFEGRRTFVEIMKLRTLDGRLRDIELSVSFPQPPDRLDVTILGLVDVTDRLRTEAELRQLQADYLRAARISLLGELATSIAHEINQPLAAVVTNAETSQRWLAREEPNLSKVQQLTERIAESGRRASTIVQRIRGMAAKRAPERVPLQLNEVVEEALLFVRHEIESRAIKLSTRLASHLPPVLGDRVELQQVVVNLLVNAVQAHGSHPGRIELSTATEPSGAVVFTIRDEGSGIAEDDLDRIFGSFYTTKEDGIGIGLALCQSIIAEHHGTITAFNHPEGGAVFRVSLSQAVRSLGDC